MSCDGAPERAKVYRIESPSHHGPKRPSSRSGAQEATTLTEEEASVLSGDGDIETFSSEPFDAAEVVRGPVSSAVLSIPVLKSATVPEPSSPSVNYDLDKRTVRPRNSRGFQRGSLTVGTVR